MKGRRSVLLVILPCVAVLGLLLYLGQRPRASNLRILFTADTHGRLEPCGCFEGQMGGLTRMDTLLGTSGRDGVLRFDVGDAIAGHKDYHLLHHAYMLQGFATLGFDALNLGAREAGLTATELLALDAASEVPMISANVLASASGDPIVAPYVVLRRAGHPIAVVGVVDPSSSTGGFGEGVAVEDMFACLHRLMPQLKKKADIIVLLAFANEQALSRLAAEFYELDVILGGDVTQPSQDLIRENRSLILYVTNEARALGRLDIRMASDGQVSSLAHAIQLVHTYIPESQRLVDLAASYRDRIREVALQVDDPSHLQADRVPGVRQQAAYVGTTACQSCHEREYATWARTAHASAFRPLVERGADADPQCIGCHTVGFGDPDGYRRADGTTRLVNVGCESCHGPGSLHVRRHAGGEENDFRFRPLGAGDCKTCHRGEFSRPFHWKRAWRKIRHGA